MAGLWAALLWPAASAIAYDSEECLACHGSGSTASRLTMDEEQFKASIHGENAQCTDCHTMVVDESHTTTPGSGAVDCGGCHDQENLHGIHGGQGSLPQCADCHTRHDIQPADDPDSSVNPDHIAATCRRCHPAQSGRVDYFSWLPAIKVATHPKGDLGTNYSDNNCLGCHQGRAAHGETEPISDDTCFQCHLKANGEKALLGYIHPRADAADQPGVFAVGIVYQLVLLACVIGGVIFFVRKFSATK